MALLGVLTLSPIVASALPPTGVIVVSPTGLSGWVPSTTGSGGPVTATFAFVSGPATAPIGSGSFQLAVGSNGDGAAQIRNAGFGGILLSDVTQLSYSTYVSSFVNCQAPYILLNLDHDNDGALDDFLFFEPCYQTGGYGTVTGSGPVPNQCSTNPLCVDLGSWQAWDARAGGWWSAFFGGAGGPPLTTIDAYVAVHPGARILDPSSTSGGLRLVAGFGAGAWDDFVGSVDSLTIGVGTSVTTYDFDPSAGPAHLDIGNDGIPYDFDFPTIQAALDAANAGDAVVVDAGIYSELVVITKSVTLAGAQAGVSGCGRSGPESIVGTPNGAFQILADNVVIDGFTITGVDSGVGISSLGAGIHTTGTFAGHGIRNNILTGNTKGLYLNSDGAFPSIVEDNFFDTNNVPGAAAGNGIYSDQGANDVTIRDNCFTGHENGAITFSGGSWLGNTQSEITVSGNTIEADAGGVVFWFASDLAITGNTWENILYTSVFLGGDVSDVAITQNTFDSAGFRGIRILAGAIGVDTGLDTDIRVNFNNFLDNGEEGLRVDPASYSGTLDATCNWWGDATGPAIAANPAGAGDEIFDPETHVDFTPWLGTSLPDPCSGPVHLDIDSDATIDVNFGAIQPAVDTATSGDTVYVDAGTYTEQVVIDVGIRLLPTVTGSLPVIRAPPFASRPTFTIPSSVRTWDAIVEVKADDASIEGFKIDGFGEGGTSCGNSFTGIMMHGGTDMAARDNEITGIRNEPFSGCQTGLGIALYADTVGDPATGEISGNRITDYQKGGIVVNIEGAMATVERNLVEGVGPTNVIAQNGIQFGFGAGGEADLNTVRGHAWTEGYWTSAGILLFRAADGTSIHDNTVLDNQIGIDVWGSSLASVRLNDVGISPSGLFSACGGPLGGTDLFGIHFQDSDGVIFGNNVFDIAFQPAARGCQSGDGIVLDGATRATVDSNIVTGYQKTGIAAGRFSNGVDDSLLSARIVNNAVTGWGMTPLIAQNGIQVADGASGSVLANHVSGNWYSLCGDYLTCYNAAGILLVDSNGIVVSGNQLSGNQAGVNLFLADSADIAGNAIAGSAWAIIVDTSNDVNVHGNTIGVPTVGPNALQVIGIWALTSLRVEVTGNVINFGGAVDPVSTLYGISFEDSSGRIVSSDVLNVRMADAYFGLQTGVGIVATGETDVDILANTVRNYQKGGIVAGRAGDGLGNDHVVADIEENTVTGRGPTGLIAQNGIQAADGTVAHIAGNVVTGNAYTGGFWTSAGILLYVAGDGVSIEDNILLDNQVGIDVVLSAAVSLLDNDVSVNPAGLFTACGGALGATSLFGIHFEESTGSIVGNRVVDIKFGAGARGCQSGVGIVLEGASSGLVQGNLVTGYQKGGIVAGRLANPLVGYVEILDNVVRGWGPTSEIAQNGIQLLGPMASGIVRGNSISGNDYTGCSNKDAAKTDCTPWVAAGLLLYNVHANLVKHSNNEYRDNQRNLVMVTTQSLGF